MSPPDPSAERAPLIVAIGGGKGGVGKTVIAANLAVAMAKLKADVVAVDADLGSANLHTMFGIDRAETTIQSLIDGRADSLEQIAMETKIPRLRIVPGSVALPGAANLQHARKQKLLRHVGKLDADVVIVDCGAGVHFNVVDFFAAAHVQLLVATAQLISLQNAYGFLKASLYRTLRQRASEAGKASLLDAESGASSELETIAQLLARVGQRDPALAHDLGNVLTTSRLLLLGNQLSDPRELNAVHALSRMVRDFLGVQASVVGGLPQRERIHRAVTRRKPFMLETGSNEPDGALMLRLAEDLLELRRIRISGAPDRLDDRTSERATASSAPPLPAPLLQYHRAHERFDVSWAATVDVAGARQAGRVLDISAGGMRLELTSPCAAGARLRVRVADRAIVLAARVVHVSGYGIGCRFDPEPSKHVLTELLSAAQLLAAASSAERGTSTTH